LFCGSCILLCKNPIFSLIFLISTFTNVIIIFLILRIEFLALTFLIIYIGAIAILFLFVIMMFNLKQLQLTQTSFELFYLIATTCFFIPKFFIVILSALDQFIFYAMFNKVLANTAENSFLCNYENLLYLIRYKNNDILLLSDFLYTDYGYLFMLTGGMLLSAMFGSIILAMLSQDKSSKFLLFYSKLVVFNWFNQKLSIVRIQIKPFF
jgi:NADH:ubiquinone oxidoreductase subunit 6 (subunit J)